MPKPLYRAVQEQLTAQIATMKPGETIPIEPELERQFNVSRATIRRAVENLVNDGLLEKRQGYGTFVKEPTNTQEVGRLYSWTSEMRQRNVQTSSIPLGLKYQIPATDMVKELQMDPGERIVVLSRVRLVKESPTAIMINYLRAKYVPGLVENGLSRDSLYEELESTYDLELSAGTETIRARLATAVEAALLGIEAGGPILNVRRVTHLRGGIPFEVVDMAARGDRYQYQAVLESGGHRRIHS